MRAYEFIDEERYKRRRIKAPNKQTEIANPKTKSKYDGDQSSKKVANMARDELSRRQAGIRGLRS